jgi:hypothetical protein
MGADIMGARYRVFAPDGNPIGDADSIDGVVDVARSAVPGCYRIDRICAQLGSAVSTSQTWGAVIKSQKGQITLDVPPWID